MRARIVASAALAVLVAAAFVGTYLLTRSTGAPAPTAAAAPAPPQAVSWEPGQMQKGIDVYWSVTADDADPAKVSAQAARILDYVVSLGANSVGLSFPIYYNGDQASTVAAAERTPTPEQLGVFLDAAAVRDLRVTVRPLIDERALRKDGGWRGAIAPASPARWFSSYQDTLRPFLTAAQEHRASSFCIAAELNSLERYPAQWQAVTSAAREVFSGQITVSRNWDIAGTPVPDLHADATGIDAYPPLHLGDDATPEQVQAAWTDWLTRTLAGRPAADVVLDEVGVPAQAGAYADPTNWGDPTLPYRPDVQAAWFAAAAGAARAVGLGGVYFWKLDFHTDPSMVPDANYARDAFVGRPAADAIRSAFAA
jgi:hypothetical protein